MMGGEDEGAKEEGRRKVYSRRSFKGLEHNESSSNLLRDQHAPRGPAGVSVFDVGSDNFSGKGGRDGSVLKGEFLPQENKVRISLSKKSKSEALELKSKLERERDVVRSLMMKMEAKEGQRSLARGFDDGDREKEAVGIGQPRMVKPLNELSACENSKVGADDGEKEKRTFKANKLYKKSEFLLAEDKIGSNKKSKGNKKKGEGSEVGMEKFPNQVWKNCSAVLERLMKHKHGWVFNTPVDAVALGLHDYFEIIETPMDLGTVKNRLTQNWYKSPMDFAKDVRLTFQNAMTYNLKGQDVYVMAEQLSKIFEDKWAPIEHQLAANFNVGLPSPTTTTPKAPLQSQAWPHMNKSESVARSGAPKRKKMQTAKSDKVQVMKKPKAKDPNKREMTYEEKQILSIDLQDLPSEKLENVVKIIKKRNPNVSQQDDEIEVDIDSFDTETLWELDRFITNYKKSLAKNKRNAEIVSQGQRITEKTTSSVARETLKGSGTKKVDAPYVDAKKPQNVNTNQEASRSGSSSYSGSSSKDSVGESLSADESDGGPTPKKS